MEVLMGLALGVGVLVLAKRGRGAVKSAVGWTARRSGWVASRVRSSLDRTRAHARDEFERGRQEAMAAPQETPGNGTGSSTTTSTSTSTSLET
jgi:hypothetical protein